MSISRNDQGLRVALNRVLEKRANVATAGGAVVAPGSANMPGKGYGAANIPGMSIHCLKCGMKHERPQKICPKCGNDTSNILDLKNQPPEYAESGETGAEAAANEEKAKTEVSKVAFSYAKLPKPLKYVGGALSLTGGTYGAIKLNQLLKVPPQEKLAAARLGNPILRMRKPGPHGDVRAAITRMLAASKKARTQIAPKR